jgi:hypothetical protein
MQLSSNPDLKPSIQEAQVCGDFYRRGYVEVQERQEIKGKTLYWISISRYCTFVDRAKAFVAL